MITRLGSIRKLKNWDFRLADAGLVASSSINKTSVTVFFYRERFLFSFNQHLFDSRIYIKG